MNTVMNKKSTKLKYFIIFVLVAVISYLAVTNYVNNRLAGIELHTRNIIAEEQALLATIAEITARNGADIVTERVVKDCAVSERSSFDNLLGRLNDGLLRSELVELERLFNRCASFFSDRKAVMAERLLREIEIYDNYVSQLTVITNEEQSPQFNVSKWKNLAAMELKQSELFIDLVRLQDEIIAALLAGKKIDSEEIKSILLEVTEVKETLYVINTQAQTIRSELISL